MGKLNKLNYRRPAFLLILMNLLGFGLLYMANDYNNAILYVGMGLVGLFLLIYMILILCRMGIVYHAYGVYADYDRGAAALPDQH